MKVVATFNVHPKRVGQIIDLARGLSSQLALEAPTGIEVITDEKVQQVASPEDAVSATAANDGSDDSGSQSSDVASPTSAKVASKAPKVKTKAKGR